MGPDHNPFGRKTRTTLRRSRACRNYPKKPGDRFNRKPVEGVEGVIAFEIGFGDATGHFDLWYRDKFSHESSAGKDYFQLASRISLWTTGTKWTQASV